MPEENDWILHGPFSDKSLLRNHLTFYLGHITDIYVPRTELCELFINGRYQGVYVFMEKIKVDEGRLDISEMDAGDEYGDDLTGGYVFKVDRNDKKEEGAGWNPTLSHFNYVAYVAPGADEITAKQDAYLRDYYDRLEELMVGLDYQDHYLSLIHI